MALIRLIAVALTGVVCFLMWWMDDHSLILKAYNTGMTRIKAKGATKDNASNINTTKTCSSQHTLPEQCRPYVKGHTLDLSHGRYIRVKGREPPYNHTSCFLMKPRYNCATTNKKRPKAWEYKFILQSNHFDESTICDIVDIVDSLGGPAALSNKTVGIFGNSFLRQVFEALACKYQDQLTAAKVNENPPPMSLKALEKRNGIPYSIQEYGNIISVPVDKRPIPLCAGNASAYPEFFEPGINVTAIPHLTYNCADELAMLEFKSLLKIFYNFHPKTLQHPVTSYQTMIGLNVSKLDYIAFNARINELREIRPHLSGSLNNYQRVIWTLKRFQKRDLKRWFGARNPRIDSPPDMHPCMPGVPDDEAALLLFSVIYDIYDFKVN